MKTLNQKNSGKISLEKPNLLNVKIGDAAELKCVVGMVLLADGNCLGPLEWSDTVCRSDKSEDKCGPFDRLTISGMLGDSLRIDFVCAAYHKSSAVSFGITLTNDGKKDLFLDRVIFLRANPPDTGFTAGFPKWPSCRFLAQPYYWSGHFQMPDCLKEIPENKIDRAHWSTVIGTKGKTSLAIGINEAATSSAEIDFWARNNRVGLELASTLRSDLKGRKQQQDPYGVTFTLTPQRSDLEGRKLRLPAGKSFTPHRMVFIPGPDPLTALDNYTAFVCKFMDWHLHHPPYAGLFAAYGNSPSNGDPGACSLGEQRLSELMQPVDRFLKPYGLTTIKTQFHGYSSSRPGDGPVDKLTEQQAENPETVEKFIAEIREKGVAPSHYDSRQDYPHGIGWHVKWLNDKGYRPAFVCRPFYNIKAGTPALDRAAADLFEMAVKDWGYRYLMFDFISSDYDSDNDTVTVEQGIHSRFQTVRERLGPEIFIEACMVWPGPVLGVADGYRPGHDWRGGLEDELAPTFACRYHYHGRFFQCDSEFFDPAIRPFTWGTQGMENMVQTEERARLWVSYNALLGYSFLAGAALERVDENRWWIFQRGIPPREGQAKPIDFLENSPPRCWLRNGKTTDGRPYYVLGLFNWKKDSPDDRPVEPAQWGLPDDQDYLFFDFWKGEVYGPARTLPNWMAPFSCRVLHVQSAAGYPVPVGSSRNVAGLSGIERWEWMPDEMTIRGIFSGAPGSFERYWAWLPGNEGIVECQGLKFEMVRPHLVCLKVDFDGSGLREWSLKLDKAIPVP